MIVNLISTLMFILVSLIVLTSHAAADKDDEKDARPVTTDVDLENVRDANRRVVAHTPGLIAFWDFERTEGDRWTSFFDPDAIDRTFAVSLHRIGDDTPWSLKDWPYKDQESKVKYDASGPFGHAVRFNQGFIYGAVERADFHETALDLDGTKPFTLVAWVRFTGKRHLVTGIWDEGGTEMVPKRYAGRRQVAIFSGLFGQRGVISHISATGAASYPQSTLTTAKYAHCAAIDGKPFEDHQWICMATTYDPKKRELRAMLNGTLTPLKYTDVVAQDVYGYEELQQANPYSFPYPVFRPRAFTLKFNGYSAAESGVYEHRLYVDLIGRRLRYDRDVSRLSNSQWRLHLDILRSNRSLLRKPIVVDVTPGKQADLPPTDVQNGDVLQAALETSSGGEWKQIGSTVSSQLKPGAPFTFGRALGIGKFDYQSIRLGSKLDIDGVAVFGRILTVDELKRISFVSWGRSGDWIPLRQRPTHIIVPVSIP